MSDEELCKEKNGNSSNNNTNNIFLEEIGNFEEPTDIDDIPQTIPIQDKLDEFRIRLINMDKNTMNTLISNITTANSINPNNNIYLNTNKNNIIKYRRLQQHKNLIINETV
jgi:hypothetical protein